ncbi:hypothetical protein R1flu_009372 [Riccia fluitans]|uniref:MRG domain-containing protein n=1 Tax=Riccia fluitans TaxID=41844 RepID=A0ABD1Z252_9MARC
MEDAVSGRKDGDGEGSDGKLKDKDSMESQFSEGDKVLAYHGPLIYEAKVQRAEFRKNEWKYFVHYLGWSKNWDEWVGTSRLMEFSDTNLEIQKKLFKDQNVDKPSKGRVSQGKQKTPAESKGEKEGGKTIIVSKGKKRKAESAVSEEKETDEPDNLMKIPIPAVLKKQLVDDWELIQSGKSIKLPRKPCVDEILKSYRELKTKLEGTDEDSVGEVLEGLQAYFDRALPAMLLYKQERAQYAEAVSDGNLGPPSSIYGAEHLLRLFVKLPELLAFINMEEEALNQLQQRLQDFLKFLQKNQSTFFLSIYDGPKAGAKVEPEEKKPKRENVKTEEDRKDRNGNKAAVERRERKGGQKEDKKEKKDSSKPSEDRNEIKDAGRTGEEKLERKDASKSLDERRDKKDATKVSQDKKRKESPRVKDETVRGSNDRTNRKEPVKGDKKEKREGARPTEKKDGAKVPDDKREKVVSKGSEDKHEKSNATRAAEEKKVRKDGTGGAEAKKGKRVTGRAAEDRKDRKQTETTEEKKEKKESHRDSEDSKDGENTKQRDERYKKEVSNLSKKKDVSEAVTEETGPESEGMDDSD